jgi:hypothetical protein
LLQELRLPQKDKPKSSKQNEIKRMDIQRTKLNNIGVLGQFQ